MRFFYCFCLFVAQEPEKCSVKHSTTLSLKLIVPFFSITSIIQAPTLAYAYIYAASSPDFLRRKFCAFPLHFQCISALAGCSSYRIVPFTPSLPGCSHPYAPDSYSRDSSSRACNHSLLLSVLSCTPSTLGHKGHLAAL